jgi:hypothetical protein
MVVVDGLTAWALAFGVYNRAFSGIRDRESMESTA